MNSIFPGAESVGLNSTMSLFSAYFTPSTIAFFTNSFSFFSFFMGAPEPEDLDLPHNETVLLTIDIQNTYLEVSDDPVERERWAFFQKRMRELVIPNIQNLQNKFRNQDMDVIHARIACMLTDVRSLADESFNVVVVEDCCAAGTDELHRKELEIINMIYCNVVTTDELVEMMAL
ncbi:hypothetical protein GQR58_025285 [Nymphon striatum]|nr:hypothetical protein GQR58_025285 [Nymphon striatum]